MVIGCRFGITEHFVDMRRALAGSWVLDEIDLEMLEEATAKRQDLLLTISVLDWAALDSGEPLRDAT